MGNRFIAAMVLLGSLTFGMVLVQRSDQRPVSESAETALPGDAANAVANAGNTADGDGTPLDTRDETIAAALRDKYAERIDNASWQIKVVTQLMDLMKQLDPDNWRARVESILRLAFPALADHLIARLDAWLDYQLWLENTYAFMEFVDVSERRTTLWAKRESLFGDDAYVIWAAEQANEAFREELATIDAAPVPMAEKADLFIDTLTEAFGDKVFGNQGYHTTQLMGEFVGMPSVQAELRQLSAAEQDAQLRDFRARMGLDAAALDRWGELDQLRREQRSTGEQYMDERRRLAETLSGDALDGAIEQLQNDLFGPEQARFIRNEEATGVYRFERPQTIGLD